MGEVKLRIGILCNSLPLQRWMLHCLRQVAEVPGVEFCVVVTRAMRAGRPREMAGPEGGFMRSSVLIRGYLRFRGTKAIEDVDAENLIGAIPRLVCSPVEGGAAYISDADLNRIGAFQPDVLLHFGTASAHGAILDLPRFGVWGFSHGDGHQSHGGPPGLWEIMAAEPTTAAMLQRIGHADEGIRALRQGWFQTVNHSLKETADTVLMHSAVWPAQVCREILAGNATAALGIPATTATRIEFPRTLLLFHFLWRQWRNKLRFHKDELSKHEEWNIGILKRPIAELLGPEGGNSAVHWLPAPAAGHYRADPFGYVRDGQLNVLYERFVQAEGHALIARLRPKKDNNIKRSWTMLDTGQHLSYPYVVEQDDKVFIVPEQAALGRVDLYRLLPENDGLEQVALLLDEPLFDPTLFRHEGRWWLLGTKPPLTNVELFAFWSDSITGPFHPHPLNPVKADIRSARPGGTPFLHEGFLWRPAQDSSLTYGGRISMNRILELSPTSFKEETVSHIGPLTGKWCHGLHTLSAVGDITLVDGKCFIVDAAQRNRVRKRKLALLWGRRKRPGPDTNDYR